MNNELFIKCFRKDMVKDELDEKLDQIYNSIKKVQSKIRITDTEYEFDVRINPFFYKPIVSHIMESSIQNINLDNFKSVQNNLPPNVIINPWVMTVYILSSEPNRGLTIGEWTLYSLKQMIERLLSIHEEHPYITWTDLGHRYMGLGHIEVLRMDLYTGDLFIQPDGGSNGYDRLAYWEQYKNQKIDKSHTIEFIDFIEKYTTIE
jgi:hypothetical protein